jgi:rhamnogalacturonan hydrolase
MELIVSCLIAFLLPALIEAQSSDSVGPTTSTAYKCSIKQCNILNYSGVASESYDNSPAIASAWAACKSGSEGILSHQGLYRVLLTLAGLHSF